MLQIKSTRSLDISNRSKCKGMINEIKTDFGPKVSTKKIATVLCKSVGSNPTYLGYTFAMGTLVWKMSFIYLKSLKILISLKSYMTVLRKDVGIDGAHGLLLHLPQICLFNGQFGMESVPDPSISRGRYSVLQPASLQL